MYALSEMIQLIFRSGIRNNEDINIYIPSSRIRKLLIDFLEVGYQTDKNFKKSQRFQWSEGCSCYSTANNIKEVKMINLYVK